MTATQSDGIKQMQNGDPIWERIRSETREAAAAEPILASFLHATILNHEEFECSLSFHLANLLDNPSAPAMMLRELILEALRDDSNIRGAIRDDLNAILDRDSACHELYIPLIGFAGSPWTLATYMVEGGSSKDFAKVKSLAFNEPEVMHQLLSKLAKSVAVYLSEQVRNGAQALQIFDTWGGSLSHDAYREFSLRYMTEIIEQLPREAEGRRVPVIVFTKGGGQWLEAIADCGADAVGLDWTTDIGEARTRVGDKVCLQGNMDPTLLNASPERIRTEVGQILNSFGEGSGHVFNLGHGVTPGINPEHVAAMVNAVVELSPAYH